MKLTTRGHYSVKALLDLVMYGADSPVTQQQISDRQHIPKAYLEQLLIRLRRAGIVQTVRGPKGGYRLNRVPQEITLGSILRAVGEAPAFMTPTAEGQAAGDWVTLALWRRINHRLIELLDHISLEDLYFDARSFEAAQGKETDFIV